MDALRTESNIRTLERYPKPFLKWAGGKRQILRELLKRLPGPAPQRYHEPFLGGGALFFGLRPEWASLSDINEELMNCYRVVRDEVEALIGSLGRHKHDSEHYYAVRERNPARMKPVQRASRTIFLNRTGFNGLFRVNSKGAFNVPFGRYENPLICDAENLRACSCALAQVRLEVAPFEAVLDAAAPGDFVYFDPPYVPLSRTASFTAYQKSGFTMADQERLAAVFRELARRGVHAMLSNADVEDVRRLFAGFPIHGITARRLVNSDAAGRGLVGEVIVTSYPIEE